MFNKKQEQSLVPISSVALALGTPMSAAMMELSEATANGFAARAITTMATEQVRAQLANHAMENLGGLVSQSHFLSQMFPLDRENFERLVGAYTYGATRTIADWGWRL